MRRGLSVAETILSATILAIVLMILFNLYPSSMLMVRRAEHRLEAVGLAQSILETEQTRPFPQLVAMLPAGIDPPGKPAAPPPTPEVAPRKASDDVELRPTLEVFIPPPPAPQPVAGKPLRIIGVRVTVRWTEAWVRDAASGKRTADESIVQEVYVASVKR